MLLPPQKIIGQWVYLQPAQTEHAEFLLRLRNTPHKEQFLHRGARDLAQQQTWMHAQDAAQRHIYFVVFSRTNGQAIGSIRIYDEQAERHSVSIGSWVMLDHTPPKMGLEALALAVQYIDHLGFEHCHFGIHPDNSSVIRFHQHLGAQICARQEDGLLLENAPRIFLQRMHARYKITITPFTNATLIP